MLSIVLVLQGQAVLQDVCLVDVASVKALLCVLLLTLPNARLPWLDCVLNKHAKLAYPKEFAR